MLCFFFTDPATTAIYTLSLHDALPIWALDKVAAAVRQLDAAFAAVPGEWWMEPGLHPPLVGAALDTDRKSTRLNSSHRTISYAVFCLKKQKIRAAHARCAEHAYDLRCA